MFESGRVRLVTGEHKYEERLVWQRVFERMRSQMVARGELKPRKEDSWIRKTRHGLNKLWKRS